MDWIDWKDKSVRIAVFSAILSAAVAVSSSAVSVYVALHTQYKQIALDLEGKLNEQSGSLTQAGGIFIAAVNSGKDLAGAKIGFNSVLDKQLYQIDVINTAAHLKNEDLEFWRRSISDLIKATNEVKSADQMPQWAELFGRVLDVDRVVSKHIVSTI